MPNIENYLQANQSVSFLFITVGIISLALSAIFLFIIKYSFFKGMAIPLLIIGMLELTIGIMDYNVATKDYLDVQHLQQYDIDSINIRELTQTECLKSQTLIGRWIEIGIILLGALLYILSRYSHQVFWKGLGLALIIQGCVLLVLGELA